MRRLFGRKKKDDESKDVTEEAESTESVTPSETPEPEPVVEPEPSQVVSEPSTTAVSQATVPISEVSAPEVVGGLPHHTSFVERLIYLFNDATAGAHIEATDEFHLEFLVLGERFWIRKEHMGPVKSGTGAIPDEDVFVRISDTVAHELLAAPTFEEFTKTYMRYYKNQQSGKFVKIELRKDVSSLARVGYARVPILKLLIGTVR